MRHGCWVFDRCPVECLVALVYSRRSSYSALSDCIFGPIGFAAPANARPTPPPPLVLHHRRSTHRPYRKFLRGPLFRTLHHALPAFYPFVCPMPDSNNSRTINCWKPEVVKKTPLSRVTRDWDKKFTRPHNVQTRMYHTNFKLGEYINLTQQS